MTRISIILLCAVLMAFISPGEQKTALIIRVDNINSTEGQLWLGIYTSQQDFLQQTASVRILGQKIDHTGSLLLEADDLPFGTYAIAVFHDKNNNGQLDQSLVGIPQEPYAFSRKPKSKWRAPSYDEVKFTFDRPNQELSMRLENW
ncbi:MAG: DUF2141 domain-containing protein [Bacteroidota bacterium]